ncbi:hypothetical protein [Oceanisphaera sp. KMM 10153]|uniref:hypothetical protein n=1 Tax=Oceanisphaera submarina TaxID=3390193 RepID=UPI003976EA12
MFQVLPAAASGGGATHGSKVIVALSRRMPARRHHSGNPPAAIAHIAPDSYLWIKPDKFHESFCQDLTPDEALVMAVTQKAPLGSTFDDNVTAPAWKKKPSWYQISSEDRMIHPVIRRKCPRASIRA